MHWVIASSPTTTSGQTADMMVSRLKRRPAFSTSSCKSANDFGRRDNSELPSANRAPRPRSKVKPANRQTSRGSRLASIAGSPLRGGGSLPRADPTRAPQRNFTGIAPHLQAGIGSNGILFVRLAERPCCGALSPSKAEALVMMEITMRYTVAALSLILAASPAMAEITTAPVTLTMISRPGMPTASRSSLWSQ